MFDMKHLELRKWWPADVEREFTTAVGSIEWLLASRVYEVGEDGLPADVVQRRAVLEAVRVEIDSLLDRGGVATVNLGRVSIGSVSLGESGGNAGSVPGVSVAAFRVLQTAGLLNQGVTGVASGSAPA